MSKMTIICDTREQVGKGWKFRASANCRGVIREKLDVGDYSLKGYEHLVCIERKTLGDLYGTLGNQTNYNRFLKEWERAKDHPIKMLIIEATLAEVNKGYPWSRVHPNNIHGKLISLQVKHNVHVVFAGRKDKARAYTRKLLSKLWNYCEDGVICAAKA